MVRRGIGVRPGGVRLGLPTVVVAALALVGCASDGQTVALPSLGVSQPSGSLSAASAGRSAAPDAQGERAEVEAAVRAYFAAANVALSTGSTSQLEAVTAESCPCTALITAVRKTYAAGTAPQAGWRLMSVDSVEPENSIALATVDYVATEYSVVNRDGVAVQHFPGHRNQALMQLAHVQDKWLVVNFDNAERVPL